MSKIYFCYNAPPVGTIVEWDDRENYGLVLAVYEGYNQRYNAANVKILPGSDCPEGPTRWTYYTGIHVSEFEL